MEHGRSGLNSPLLNGDHYDSLTALPYTKLKSDPEKVAQHLLYNEATRLGGDWLEASEGHPITEGQYDNLFKSGYVSRSSESVLEIFYDWQDYQQVAKDLLADKQVAERLKDTKLLKQAKDEVRAGLIPDLLLKNSERYTEANEDKKDKDKKSKPLVRYRLTDESAPPKVIRERYSRYILADYLLKNRPSGQEVTEERMISIALGFNHETDKPLSSFLGSLKNSNPLITEADVERAAEEFGLYSYIYPGSRQDHLRKIHRIGSQKTQKAIGGLSLASEVRTD